MRDCPCGSQKDFSECCEPFLQGQRIPATPEELMRSRYTAYSLADVSYIERTMKPPASVGFDAKEAQAWAQSVKWEKLEVLDRTSQGLVGAVEFKAYYRVGNKQHVLHERSEFQCDGGRWYYVSGKID